MVIGLVQCPFCHTRVIPMSPDNRCPSCRELISAPGFGGTSHQSPGKAHCRPEPSHVPTSNDRQGLQEMNESHVSELQQRYAKMPPGEFAEIRRDNLTDEAIACYDREIERRSTPQWKAAEDKYYEELRKLSKRNVQRTSKKARRLWQLLISIVLLFGYFVFGRSQPTDLSQIKQQTVCINSRCMTYEQWLKRSIKDEAMEFGLPDLSEYETEKWVRKELESDLRNRQSAQKFWDMAIGAILGVLGALLGWIVARLTSRKSGNSQQTIFRASGYPLRASDPYVLWSSDLALPTRFRYGVGSIVAACCIRR